jgi:hypothetical protein
MYCMDSDMVTKIKYHYRGKHKPRVILKVGHLWFWWWRKPHFGLKGKGHLIYWSIALGWIHIAWVNTRAHYLKGFPPL